MAQNCVGINIINTISNAAVTHNNYPVGYAPLFHNTQFSMLMPNTVNEPSGVFTQPSADDFLHDKEAIAICWMKICRLD